MVVEEEGDFVGVLIGMIDYNQGCIYCIVVYLDYCCCGVGKIFVEVME